MRSIITSQKSYSTVERAIAKLRTELGDNFEGRYRWLIAVSNEIHPTATNPSGVRFVPTVVGAENCGLAHYGIMVIS